MISDTFPRQPVEAVAEQTSEEIAGVTSVANVETTTRGNSSESLSTSSKYDFLCQDFRDKNEFIFIKNFNSFSTLKTIFSLNLM